MRRTVSRIDRITVRAKDVERFVAKATRQEGDTPKYSDPLRQIHDQIGERVVVFYISDAATHPACRFDSDTPERPRRVRVCSPRDDPSKGKVPRDLIARR